jgi:hypothetical protein
MDRCAYCWAHDLDCALWTPAMFDRLGKSGPGPRVYDILAEATRAEVILDSSKTPWWFLNVSSHADFAEWPGKISVLHCVRHPFAFAVSLANRTGESLEQCVLSWMIINRDALSVVQRCARFIPILTVYHNRVLKEPQRLLSTVSSWLGLGMPAQERVHHYLGGNVAAWPFKAKQEQITPEFRESVDYFAKVNATAEDDGRWRSKIDTGMRWRLAGLPGVREMCTVLGIDIDALILS